MRNFLLNRTPRFTAGLTLVLILLAGSFLRLWNLGRTSFWVDEVNAFFAAKSWVASGKLAFPSGFIYDRAPLYTQLTGLISKIIGAGETATRLPAALFGILCIGMAYLLAKALFNRNTALITAFFMAFSHFEVGWSRTAKMYTMLQFLTLAFLYAFARGFEPGNRGASPTRFRKWGPSAGWLALAGVLFLYAYGFVHNLIVLVLPGLVLYTLTMTLVRLVEGRGLIRFWNKYSAVSLTACAAVLAAWLILPSLRQKALYFFSYTPAWAEGASSSQNRQFLVEFLLSSQRFPLAAFFFTGSLLLLTRRNKLGWFSWCCFFSSFFALTFMFTHRTPTYLFHVYPLFLAVAAFGFAVFVEQERAVLDRNPRFAKPWPKSALIAAAFSVFIISPWLRITLHIPFFQDGISNMAVTPDEWREASRTLLQRKQPGDLVITSLPQVALAYGLKSDFGLNMANLALTKVEKVLTPEGRYADIYAGVTCIETPDEFQKLVESHARGWLAVTQFHLENDNYIPAAVRAALPRLFQSPEKTANGTVLIYHWDRSPRGGS